MTKLVLFSTLMRVADPLKGVARGILPQPAIEALRPWFHRLRDRRILLGADRVYLERTLIPALADAGARRVLFIGTRSYTKPALKAIEKAGLELWTLDIDPAAESFGAPGRHITADVRNLSPDMVPKAPDAVLMNGVLGYGVDDPAGCEDAVRSVAGILRPNGLLIIGWNPGRSPDPIEVALRSGLRKRALTGRQSSVTFEQPTHRYDFFEKC